MISAVILKVASLCNLNCTYCYMYNHEDKSYLRRPKLISDETFDATLAVMKRYCEQNGTRMAINFHGGEPTLIGAERFGVLAGRAREILGQSLSAMAMQTNATLLDDAWIDILRHHQVNVGVSLDGPREINDVARVDHAGRGSY
ncbi:MAG TPA: radical SAM protein, partial [Thermoanaerobaculia bacterium]